MKRICSIIVAAAICLSMLGSARAAVFEDISDDANLNTAVAALKSMGVIEGYDDGLFHSEDSLTRAQLCKLVILLVGKGSDVESSSRRTMFSDVRGSHWAAGYVNLACTLGYVSGYGNGCFGPDDSVTYAQAVTILLNMLGYTPDDIGYFWPDDYVSFASSIDLDSGLSLSGDDVLTRGDAAVLLLNLLRQKNAAGSDYVNSLAAKTVSSALVMSANDSRAVVCASGKVEEYETGVAIPVDLTGEKGTLLLNAAGAVVGFVPDDSKTMLVQAATITGNSITTETGVKYSIPESAALVINGECKSWELGFADLYTGCSAKLYYADDGTVELVYVSSGAESSSVYVAANKITGGVNPFESAFGLASGQYSIVKNGAAADVSDLAQYDVATYDAVSSTLLVSDYKLTAAWEDAYPNASSPATVTLMGHEFEVLETAVDDFAAFKLGSQITLLLTSDMKVAAAYSASKVKADDAVGVLNTVNGDNCTVTLTNGLTIKGTLAKSINNAQALVGSLVTVSGKSSGLYVGALSFDKAVSSWNIVSGTIGSDELAPDVKIYERIGNGAVTRIDLGDILVSSVNKSKIEHVGYNAAGKVSLLVLSDVTGDCYTYGVATSGAQSSGTGTISVSNRTVYVTNSDGKSDTLVTGKTFVDGRYIGISANSNGKLAGYVELKKITNISRDDFQGDTYVETGNYQIPISDNVQVYNSQTGAWTTLELAKAYAEDFTVYYERTPETGAKIRVIVCNYSA